MAGRPSAGIRETRSGATEFMLKSRRAARNGVRASVVAVKRVTTVERRERREIEESWPERQKINRCECLQRLCRKRRKPSAYDLVELLDRRFSWRPRDNVLSPGNGNLLTGEPDAGNPPVRFGGRGDGTPFSLPLSGLEGGAKFKPSFLPLSRNQFRFCALRPPRLCVKI